MLSTVFALRALEVVTGFQIDEFIFINSTDVQLAELFVFKQVFELECLEPELIYKK